MSKAYIKIQFNLLNENNKRVNLLYRDCFDKYKHIGEDLNKSLLDFALEKQAFIYHQRLKLVDLNDYMSEYKNICTIIPIHISDINVTNALILFYFYLEVDSYVVGVDDLEELKEWVIGDRLEGIFKEVYGQLTDGWGENLYFEIFNYEGGERETFFPEFIRSSMALVEEME